MKAGVWALVLLGGCGGSGESVDAPGDDPQLRIAMKARDEELRKFMESINRLPPIVKAPLQRVDTKSLVRTVVVPHPRVGVPEGMNGIWCATWQLAWDAMSDEVVKGPLEIGPPAPKEFVDAMNRRDFPHEALSPSAYLAMAGRGRDGIAAKIRKELKERFGEEMLEIGRPADRGCIAYGYLRKSLPFAYLFDPAPGPLLFAGGTKKVAAFGLDHDSTNPDAGKILGQVTILRERAGEFGQSLEFVIDFAVKGGKDRLILAMVPPGPSLAATWESIRELLKVPGQRLTEGSTLIVPKMNFEIQHEFKEIVGSSINTGVLETVDVARQTVRFSLDEGGADLESHAILATLGESPSLIVNRPFLLALLEKGRTEPYLLMWIANDELLAEVL